MKASISASTRRFSQQAAPRFLICRLSAIGDCILTMPLACALRDHFPNAEITWVVQGPAASLLEGHSGIDRVLRISKQQLRSPAGLWSLRKLLRTFQFDVALDPQGLTKSSFMAWLSGTRRRIGFRPPVGREVSSWLNNELVESQSQHVVERYLELLRPLGVATSQVRFDVPRSPAAEQAMQPFLSQPEVRNGFAVINPGAGWDSKLWPTERYVTLAERLGREYSLPTVVVWAGAREQAWAEQIVAESQKAAFLAPKTSLPELAAILRRARLFVGSDTGPLHLAAAVGVRCVGLYGPTRPEDCGPYGAGHQAIQAYYQAGTSRQRRSAANDAMRAISIEMALQGCKMALAGASGESGTGRTAAA